MTRTNAGLIWVIAIVATALVAVPAIAADGYETLNSLAGGESQSPPLRSLNSVTGSEDIRSDSPSGTSAPTSLNATLADNATSAAGTSNIAADAYRSVTSVAGDNETPTSLVQAPEASGFDWGDAGIGALVALALAMTAFAGTRLLGQSRRTAAESQA